MTRVVINFPESEIKLLDKISSKTGLSYHDLIMKAVRQYDRNQRR